MGYTRHSFDVRYVDADTENIYQNNVKVLTIDSGTADTTKIIGQTATGKILQIYANTTDAVPLISLVGNGIVSIYAGEFQVHTGSSQMLYVGNSANDTLLQIDTNRDLYLKTQGTGKVKFGTYTAGAAADSTGYISILDAAGNARKLMVQA